MRHDASDRASTATIPQMTEWKGLCLSADLEEKGNCLNEGTAASHDQ